MGVYLEDLTYKEILPILARTGKLIDTRKIIEIDDDVWDNEKYKLIRMTQEARVNKEMAERRTDETQP